MIVVEIAGGVCIASIAHATWLCWRHRNDSQDFDFDLDLEHRPGEISWLGQFPRLRL